MTGKLNRTVWAAILVLVVALGLRLGVGVASCRDIPVSSDEAITMLQAERIAAGEPQWLVYAQPYQFPLEAYLTSPLVRWLPRNALGARCTSFLIALVSLALMLGVLVKSSRSVTANWPAALLILFPSAYLMNIQFGYPIPHYTSAFLLWWALLLTALSVPSETSGRSCGMVLLSGILAGLAFTNNMVSLAVVVPAVVVVLVRPGGRRFFVHTLCLGAGGAAGLAPYWIGLQLFPGAQNAVSGTRSLGAALECFWSPMLKLTLPAALGVGPAQFPDSAERVCVWAEAALAMGIVFMLVLVLVTVILSARMVRRVRGCEWPTMGISEIMAGAAWLGLGLFMVSNRAGAYSYRYLTPAAWGFPFLVACLWSALAGKRGLRGLLAGAVSVLVLINVVTIGGMVQAWKDPDFGPRVAGSPDLRPALDYLRTLGIRHCVASHWAAYRINYLAGGALVCSQPMNERFSEWRHVPYKEEVDAATNVAYVLTDRIRFLIPSVFDRHLRTMLIDAERASYGEFVIYSSFRPAYGADKLVDLAGAVVTASHQPVKALRVVNSDRWDRWSSRSSQTTNMWIQVDLPAPAELSRLVIYRGKERQNSAGRLRLDILAQDGWTEVPYAPGPAEGKFLFQNGHPVYGYPSSATLCFKPITGSSFRLSVQEPKAGYAWTVTEIEAFSPLALPGS